MSGNREIIARNVAQMLHDGEYVNLGVGIPTLVSNYLPEGTQIFLHGENGSIGQARQLPFEWDIQNRESVIAWKERHGDGGQSSGGHRDLINAGNSFITLIPGGSCFDSAMAFSIARGGHLDATVLGALQVDEECNLANWAVPGKFLAGMGGAMDIVSGARRVIIAMEHCDKNGASKIVKKCTLPLTATHCVTDIVTEMCVIKCAPEMLVVTAIARGVSREDLISKTGAKLHFADTVVEML